MNTLDLVRGVRDSNNLRYKVRLLMFPKVKPVYFNTGFESLTLVYSQLIKLNLNIVILCSTGFMTVLCYCCAFFCNLRLSFLQFTLRHWVLSWTLNYYSPKYVHSWVKRLIFVIFLESDSATFSFTDSCWLKVIVKKEQTYIFTSTPKMSSFYVKRENVLWWKISVLLTEF